MIIPRAGAEQQDEPRRADHRSRLHDTGSTFRTRGGVVAAASTCAGMGLPNLWPGVAGSVADKALRHGEEVEAAGWDPVGTLDAPEMVS